MKLNKETIKAIESRASKIILPIDENTNEGWNDFNLYEDDTALLCTCPIQSNEKFAISKDGALLKKSDFDEDEAILIDKKFYHISDFVWHEVSNVEVKRVEDINTARKMESIMGANYINKSGSISIEDFDVLISEFNSHITSKYIFIADIKRGKIK